MSTTETEVQRWSVGDATITSVVEDETHHIPPEFFFPEATPPSVARHPWLVPDFADADGNIALRVQAFVVEIAGTPRARRPVRRQRQDAAVPVLERAVVAVPRAVRRGRLRRRRRSTPSCTPTCTPTTSAGTRTSSTARGCRRSPTPATSTPQRELDYCRADGDPGIEDVYGDSIAPIVAAGLADIVDEDADLGDGLRLEPTPGHTPGHVSLWIESDGERALITGDFLHHPVQCAEPSWAEIGDDDVDQARGTRRAMLQRAHRRARCSSAPTSRPARPAGSSSTATPSASSRGAG